MPRPARSLPALPCRPHWYHPLSLDILRLASYNANRRFAIGMAMTIPRTLRTVAQGVLLSLYAGSRFSRSTPTPAPPRAPVKPPGRRPMMMPGRQQRAMPRSVLSLVQVLALVASLLTPLLPPAVVVLADNAIPVSSATSASGPGAVNPSAAPPGISLAPSPDFQGGGTPNLVITMTKTGPSLQPTWPPCRPACP